MAKEGHRDEGNGKFFSLSRDKEQGASRTQGQMCHNKLFEETGKGTDKGMQRKPNLNRFVNLGQIRSINKILSGFDSTSSNKIRSVPASDNSDGKPKTQLLSAAGVKLDNSDPDKKPTQNSIPGDLTAQDSSGRTTRQKSFTPTQKNSYPGKSTDEHPNARTFTPTQNSYPRNSSYEDSSASASREKSFTPTLTDLENSIHQDCRLDKVLRVALDYALPEEIGLGESSKCVTSR